MNTTPKFCSLRFTICMAVSFLLVGCAATEKRPASLPGHPKAYKIGKSWYQPLKESRGFSERGIASWYGRKFHGRKTANGETYNMYALTAAHKTLPLGTYVRVHNLDNNKTIDVRVNDRGPFVRGRIIDLSYESARRLGVVGPGTARVKIVALGSAKKGATREKGGPVYVPGNYFVGDFTIQVGAFREQENALRLRDKLAKTYRNAHIAVHKDAEGKTLYRVRVARCRRLENAREYEKILEAAGYTDALVVAR